ncbi:primosomal protein N' [Thermotoga sp. KOL6]|uniref:replication restart helicase PriA n=1 Tax=Thermotoga sp. KOL6 TaxID=126741 RepID=UPI00004EABE7|nr:primosomal protein N' [Thermotoga sp. KOL6]PLV58767.1 primosomal protein N' [Thermotoga sp. KOL6]CAI44386.1 primosomal protein N [Thermotoga sp. KOL6]
MYYDAVVSGSERIVCVFSEEILEPGERVKISLRGEKIKCYVLRESSPKGEVFRVKERDGKSFLKEEHVKLAEWVSRRFGSPLGSVFDQFFPGGIDDYKTEMVVSQSPLLDFQKLPMSEFLKTRGEEVLKEMLKKGLVRIEKDFYLREPKPRQKRRVYLKRPLSGIMREPLTFKQKLVVEYLQFNDGVLLRELLEDLGISRSVIDSLIEKGIVEVIIQDVSPKRVISLRKKFEGRISRINLFFGPTGSGKTEALFDLVGEHSKKGVVLFLVPEVPILTHTLSRLKGIFPDLNIGIFHSYLSKARKNLEWYKAFEGKVDVLLGTRSAVFVPVNKLSLIIVDEEHDESFYQYTSPSYDAVAVARKISELFDVPLVLSSATPSLGSYKDAKEGKIKLFTFSRNCKSMSVEVIDMRKEEKIGSFALKTLNRIEETLENGRRVLVYVRRKGYWGRIQCESCGYVLKCRDCDVSLVYHKEKNALKCHQCGREYEVLETCPVCGGRLYGRIGGTEKVEKELQKFFPDKKVKRVDREVVEDIMEMEDYIDDLTAGEIDILVGTKMITKSFNVPEVGLVCVLDVDSLVFLPDFSASLRTFQLIVQALGRASRNEEGRAILQTYNPDESVIMRAVDEDIEGFYEEELERRRLLGYPPYKHLIHIALKTKDPSLGKRLLLTLKERLRNGEVLGPSEHWIFKLKGLYRYHLLIKTDTPEESVSEVSKLSRVLGLDTVVWVDPPSLEIPD